ncbi:vesicular glutamate transporter 2-like isoform X1 [Homalodisca vitripennis]|uniref:vesicular glutamate transporter 2-like isoform X1 n=1 Tax=Homalodisca vitripennis TaxID=197043 RepID=UPI001EECBAB7|nr:vesicular glutamate transporter 2-like isoform X1 [Homalodisca vitripennis]
MDNLPRRRPTGFRRRHLVTVLAFLGIFIVENLRWTFVNAIEQIRTPYNVTLDNGKVVEKRNLNFDVLEIAHISSASFYGYVATQILGGWLGACLGGSRVFGVGVAFTALFSFVLPFVVHGGTAKSLITIRVIQGLFEGVTYPSIIAVWSRWAPPQERARLVTIAFSGGFFSFLVNPPVCRFIAYTLDWSFIFYITGILGLIWCAVWLTVVKDKPEDDPHISTEELKYLRDNLDCGPNDSVPKHIVYPWDEFVKSMPVWAIVVAHACTNYCFYSLVVGIPWFLRDTHNYQLDSTGLLSLLPYLMITVLMPVAGVLADWLRNAELLTTTHVRKTFICSTFISQAILIFLAAHLNSFNGTSLCLVLALGLTAFSWAAFSVNHLDIAPQHASALMGFSNTFASILGFLSPSFISYFRKNGWLHQWQYSFNVIIAVHILASLFYCAFASGERQRWAPPAPTPESESLSLPQRSHVI